jgi:hypothetical protein
MSIQPQPKTPIQIHCQGAKFQILTWNATRESKVDNKSAKAQDDLEKETHGDWSNVCFFLLVEF